MALPPPYSLPSPVSADGLDSNLLSQEAANQNPILTPVPALRHDVWVEAIIDLPSKKPITGNLYFANTGIFHRYVAPLDDAKRTLQVHVINLPLLNTTYVEMVQKLLAGLCKARTADIAEGLNLELRVRDVYTMWDGTTFWSAFKGVSRDQIASILNRVSYGYFEKGESLILFYVSCMRDTTLEFSAVLSYYVLSHQFMMLTSRRWLQGTGGIAYRFISKLLHFIISRFKRQDVRAACESAW